MARRRMSPSTINATRPKVSAGVQFIAPSPYFDKSLQQTHHVASDAFRRRRGCEAGSHSASPVNQEFRKVPFYAVAQLPALLLPEPDIERVGVVAIDLDLGKQRKGYTVGTVAEGRDLRV